MQVSKTTIEGVRIIEPILLTIKKFQFMEMDNKKEIGFM